jgi:gliding motility-associated-like protein
VGDLYPEAGNDFSVCMSEQLETLVGNYSSGTWSGPGVTTSSSFSSSIAGKGEHELIFSVLAVPGCIYRDTLMATVKGISTLELSVTGEESFCYTGQTTLTATDLSDVTYKWHFGQNENDFTALEDDDREYSATTLGYYKVVAFDGLCSREIIHHLIPSAFDVDIQPNFDSIAFCHNAPIQLEAQSVPEATYTWISLTSAHDSEIVKTSYDNFNTEIEASGSYQLTVENHGCSFVSHVMTTKRLPADSVFVPNIITPNGDGYNDQFTIAQQGFDKYSLTIINRYGTVIFRANENSDWWPEEGTSGIYFWVLNYFAACENRERQIKGTLHVVR